MKKKIYLWAAFVLPLLFVACSDDKNDDPVDPVLKFKEAEVIADPAGGTYTAELESNVAWTVTSKSSNISSLNMESGKGNATLSFFVSPKTGDDVTGNITVKAASSALTAVLTVKQDKISIAFVPADTTDVTNYFVEVAGRNILYRYTIEYADAHREALNAVRTIDELQALLDSDKTLVEDFIRYAARKGVAPRYGDIARSRRLIEAQLRAYIGRNTALEDNGFYVNIYPVDNVVMRSLGILNACKEND